MQRKKKPFLTLKNRIFRSPKKRTFSKGLTHAFGQKMPFFLIYSDLVKTRVEIMLKIHWREKRNRFDYKKQRFSKSKTSHFFKGLTHAFGLKMSSFS